MREVKTHSQRKSVSVETTFDENISHWNDCENELLSLVSSLSRRLDATGLAENIRKVYVKVKMENFVLHTAETITIGLDIKKLLELFKRLREQYPKPIRLLGIGVRFPDTSSNAFGKQLNIPF